jgi:hypothetical protein
MPMQTPFTGPRLYVGFHLLDTTDDLELSETDRKRLLCHVLIQHLDEHGLLEALETLAEMVHFQQNPPPPPPWAVPAGPSVRVQVGETIVRPVFPITEVD